MLNQKDKFILWFKELSIEDVPLVGGKNASLGEMYQKMAKQGVRVPNGFAITSKAYNFFIDQAGIREKIKDILKDVDTTDIRNLREHGFQVRECILQADFPEQLEEEIIMAYQQLSQEYKENNVDVAVRSSATAEDLPDASFAGQQETYLNVRGRHVVLEATKKCFASLFTNRAISYREDKNFDHFDISLSVGIQKMVRSDLACSGVAFSIDTESGFQNGAVITGAWGLGEMVVQGKVDPDEFIVFKPTLKKGCTQDEKGLHFKYRPIIEKRLGSKRYKMVYTSDGAISSGGSVKEVPVTEEEEKAFILTDEEVLQLAYWTTIIEEHYQKPMDIEWAKDGKTKQLFIVQARPETVQSQNDGKLLEEYILEEEGKLLVEGVAVGAKIGAGKANVIRNVADIAQFKKGDILITEITDPDWEPIMKIASGIVTNSGGRTSHAAIISRELGIPALVGTGDATGTLKTGEGITVSCAQGERGFVYQGELKFHVKKTDLSAMQPPKTKIMMIVADTSRVFNFAQIPNQGIGLAREELIILNHIKVHPLALLHFDKIIDPEVKREIEEITAGYNNKIDYFVQKLADGVGKITAAFWPHDVIVRMSDFKSNEYANLLGGKQFEPHEENPMIGWRGASRYYDEKYQAAFALECEALRRVREEMGLTNMKAMIPFCRTVEEGKKVIALMAKNGLVQGKDGFEVYVMCEIPANVMLAEEFADVFDGFSIGSNDLTQLTLGLDRDGGLISGIGDERNPAVKKMIKMAILAAHKKGRKIGICGQGPSDFPELAEFLVDCGIDSIALNPDSVIKTTQNISQYEQKQKPHKT
ncbi:MAG: phosphoenolpyruvate synthase [Candidatus Kerfeldbacteria bacterium RIFOXYC2_FULL_38_9]|uniref:Phosphoenolpyruvate synthase n=1 Tax=Candidatus Kerfeldbacteria bacterium RIFOXYB2_FULL_38_14 TaxID=1798547 RepID=A0A1G2BGG0_9BACT|nr:MAG: phosphoenolpyruvate synthase [Candidatus Kerfeldbacteria bacterium RIFOXYB2_FULL_38_14]OGY88403.1 MAG: phosphoenolpyruvate synthase [Candidatus Kerfeldbacteria bacterium RIFOXYC2_FULL_38_9]